MRIEDVEVGMKLKCVSAKHHLNKLIQIGDVVTVSQIREYEYEDSGFNVEECPFLWMPNDFEPAYKSIRRLE